MIRLITNESELLEYKQDIISLFTRCFKRELTEEFWDWAYISSTSRSPIVSLMLHNEKVVGHYAVIAFDLYAKKGKKTKTALSITTMIDKDFRQQDGGIFALANSVYDYLEKDGVEFVFAYPNEMSSSVFRLFLDWKIDSTSRLITAKGSELNNGLLANICKDRKYFFDIKDNDFLAWRLNKPGSKYYERSNSIVKEYNGSVDLLYFDKNCILDSDVEYNLLVGCGEVEKNRGAKYDFGVKRLTNTNVNPCDIASMMILSDVF
jgi:hypothetical protein